MSPLERLIEDKEWDSFLEYQENRYLPKKELEELKEYIEKRKYQDACHRILEGTYTFSIPQKKYINKNGSSKKRIVYSFPKEETILLKMVHYLFQDYDFLLASNCYSFRKKIGPKQAFEEILKKHHGYGYKVDIHNYFNSIPISKLLPMLEEKLDSFSYTFLKSILESKKVSYQGEIIEEEKGVMAGTPISCFLSNLYLSELDFRMKKECYARYADDILLFMDTKEALEEKVKEMHAIFSSLELTINPEKEKYIDIQSPFEFLGFSYYQGEIDLADHAKKKMKDKIRRKARALRRWMLRKNLPPEKAMKALNNIFNYKFFCEKKGRELNWSIWYFPVLTTDCSLKEIDHYFQDQLRYIKTGRVHQKDKRNIPYEVLKETGYRSLVYEYYAFQKRKSSHI